MTENLNLWSEISNSKWMTDVTFMVLLTKVCRSVAPKRANCSMQVDRLAEKLRTSPLHTCPEFADYVEPSSDRLRHAINFIRSKILARAPLQQKLYSRVVCAVDLTDPSFDDAWRDLCAALQN